MNINWKIKDMIKRGQLQYNVGDEVVVYCRKSNGYPKALKDDITYYIKQILSDGHLIVSNTNNPKIGYEYSTIKVHKKYVIDKSILREVKLNSILDQTNLN